MRSRSSPPPLAEGGDGGPQRVRVPRPVEASDVRERERVGGGRGGPGPRPARPPHVLRVEPVLDHADRARRQPALRLQLARPRRADRHDGVGGAEHAALEGGVERPGRRRHRELVVEVDPGPRVAEVGHPRDAPGSARAPEGEPDEVRRVRRPRREHGVRPPRPDEPARGAGGERDPPDAGVREEHVRARPEPGALAGRVRPDAPHGDRLAARAAGERAVQAERVERARADHLDARRHVGRERGVEARVGTGLDGQDHGLDARRAEVLRELQRPLDARPARRREVVRDEEEAEDGDWGLGTGDWGLGTGR